MKQSLITILLMSGVFNLSHARVTCKQMQTCEQACKALKQGHKSLDRDHDGIPCESMCDEPCER